MVKVQKWASAIPPMTLQTLRSLLTSSEDYRKDCECPQAATRMAHSLCTQKVNSRLQLKGSQGLRRAANWQPEPPILDG